MPAADPSLARIGGLALLATVMTAGSALAAPAGPCVSYGPAVVDLEGVLQRESFAQPPVEDLFVDPNDPEVTAAPDAAPSAKAASPNASAPAPPAAAVPVETKAAGVPGAAAGNAAPGVIPAGATAASLPTIALDPSFIGPPMPGTSSLASTTPAPDPVLLRARPLKRPPRPEQVWVLALRSSLCLTPDSMDRVNVAERKVRRIQLVIARADESMLRALQKKKVVVRGQLFHAVSRRHYLPVLLNVETIRPPEWIPELKPPPPAPLPPLAPLPVTSR